MVFIFALATEFGWVAWRTLEVNQCWLSVCLMYPLALVPDAAVYSTPCCFGPALQLQLFVVYAFLVFETRLRRCHRSDFKGTGTPPLWLDFDKCMSHMFVYRSPLFVIGRSFFSVCFRKKKVKRKRKESRETEGNKERTKESRGQTKKS